MTGSNSESAGKKERYLEIAGVKSNIMGQKDVGWWQNKASVVGSPALPGV